MPGAKPALLALLALALGVPWLALAARSWLESLVRAEVARSMAEADPRLVAIEERLDSLASDRGSQAWRRLSLDSVLRDVERGCETPEQKANRDLVPFWYCLTMRHRANRQIPEGVSAIMTSAFGGQKGETLAALKAGNWSKVLSISALGAAAFGNNWAMEGNRTFEPRKAKTKVDRVAVLRALFSDDQFVPDLEFLDRSFDKCRRKKMTAPPEIMAVLAWGVLRTLMRNLSKTGDCWLLEDGFLEFAIWQNYSGDPPMPETKHVFQFLEDHPKALAERNSDGETLLMEFSKNRAGRGCAYSLLMLHQMYSIPITDMNNYGETAAMLAVMGRQMDVARGLEWSSEETDFAKLQPQLRPFFRNQYPAMTAAAVHGAILLVSLAFYTCRPEVIAGRIGSGIAFAVKVAILITINCFLKYGSHLWNYAVLLRRPDDMLQISWVGGIEHNVALQTLLVAGFVALSAYDLLQACRPSLFSRRASPLPASVDVSSIYEDPSVPTYICIHVFLLSGVFVSFYVSTLLSPIRTTYFTRCLWAAALFVQVHLSTKRHPAEVTDLVGRLKELGRWTLRLDEENRDLWRALFREARLVGAGKHQPLRLSQAEVLTRFVMNYLANGLFKILTLYTLPHYLAGSARVSEFVLHAFSVQFIYKIDDLVVPKQYQVEEEESETESETDDGEAAAVLKGRLAGAA